MRWSSNQARDEEIQNLKRQRLNGLVEISLLNLSQPMLVVSARDILKGLRDILKGHSSALGRLPSLVSWSCYVTSIM